MNKIIDPLVSGMGFDVPNAVTKARAKESQLSVGAREVTLEG